MEPELLSTDNADTWKAFGGDTEAGRLLKKLYNGTTKPVINYPKPKTKTKVPTSATPFIPAGGKDNNFRSNQLQVKVSDRGIKAPTFHGLSSSKQFHPIDHLAGRRKPYREIEKEINAIKKHFESYRLTVVKKNTNEDKEKLQQIFSYSAGRILPRELLPGSELLDRELSHANTKRHGRTPKDRLEELEEIYDQVVMEIDARKNYANEMISLGHPEKAVTVEKEILERLGELKKINKLIEKEKQEASNQ